MCDRTLGTINISPNCYYYNYNNILQRVYAALCSLNTISNPSSIFILRVTLYGTNYHPYFTGEEASRGFKHLTQGYSLLI